MNIERNIGQEVISSANDSLNNANRVKFAAMVPPRIVSIFAGYQALESYNHDGNERAAIAAAVTMATMEGLRLVIAKTADKYRSAILAEGISREIDEIIGQNGAVDEKPSAGR